MSIGENIYRLRTQKNLSQGALADMLDVSRQSVSKWETENAIPDLDKLIKMCEIFEISMDELTLQTENIKPPAPITTTLSHAQITGYILFVATIFGFILSVANNDSFLLWILVMPVAVLTAICLKIKEHTAYWCAWTILNALGVYMLTAFGIVYFMGILIPGYIAMYFYTKKEFREELPQKILSAKSIFAILVSDIAVMAGWYMFRHSALYMQILAEEITSIYSVAWILYRFGFAGTCVLYFICLNALSYVFYMYVVNQNAKKTEIQ